MEDRVTRLEIVCEVFKAELDEFKKVNREEITELKNALKAMSNNLDKLNIVLIKIKWLITGAVLLYLSQEVGITAVLKKVIGAI